jgi:hypothetical protein
MEELLVSIDKHNEEKARRLRKERHDEIDALLPGIAEMMRGAGPLVDRLWACANKYAADGHEVAIKHLRFYYGLALGRYRLHTVIGRRLPDRLEDLLGEKERSQLEANESISSLTGPPPQWLLNHARSVGRHEGLADADYVSLKSWLAAHAGSKQQDHPFYTVLLKKVAAQGLSEWPLYGYFWRESAYVDGELFSAGPSTLTDQEFRNLVAFFESGQHR